MRSYSILFVITCLLAAGSFQAAEAYGGGGGFGQGGGSGMHRGRNAERKESAQPAPINTDGLRELLTFSKDLQLTDTQDTAIRQIRSDSLKEASAKAEGITVLNKELSALLDRETPDFAGAHVKLKQMTDSLAGVQDVAINAYEKAYNLLTSEQKTSLTAIRKRLRAESEREKAPAAEEMER